MVLTCAMPLGVAPRTAGAWEGASLAIATAELATSKATQRIWRIALERLQLPQLCLPSDYRQ